MTTFKVYFKGSKSILIKAKDELDAALIASKNFNISLILFCYAVKLDVMKTDE